MKKIFSLAMVVGCVTALSLAGSAYAQTVEIGTWAGFRTAAFLLRLMMALQVM